jgi:hypothetical protein
MSSYSFSSPLSNITVESKSRVAFTVSALSQDETYSTFKFTIPTELSDTQISTIVEILESVILEKYERCTSFKNIYSERLIQAISSICY